MKIYTWMALAVCIVLVAHYFVRRLGLNQATIFPQGLMFFVCFAIGSILAAPAVAVGFAMLRNSGNSRYLISMIYFPFPIIGFFLIALLKRLSDIRVRITSTVSVIIVMFGVATCNLPSIPEGDVGNRTRYGIEPDDKNVDLTIPRYIDVLQQVAKIHGLKYGLSMDYWLCKQTIAYTKESVMVNHYQVKKRKGRWIKRPLWRISNADYFFEFDRPGKKAWFPPYKFVLGKESDAGQIAQIFGEYDIVEGAGDKHVYIYPSGINNIRDLLSPVLPAVNLEQRGYAFVERITKQPETAMGKPPQL